MKKIIFSLAMIAAVGAIAIGATTAFFNDTEKSAGNTFTAGTIDISVDGENPWKKSWSNYLDKPCETNYMTFTIKNDGENAANIWKKIDNVVNGAGARTYPTEDPVASSEPEYQEGIANGRYVERDNLSAFMVYDMAVCVKGQADATGALDSCPMIPVDDKGNKKPDLSNNNWKVIVDETDQVRVDNIAGTWIKIAKELQPGQEMVVSQSYHLMTWDDSGQPMVTNWAQGDTMTFDITLDARQLTAPVPGTEYQKSKVVSEIQLVKRDPTTWAELSGPSGTLTYEVEAAAFNYDLSVSGLPVSTNYSLVYYADPFPGNHPGKLIADYTSDGSGNIIVNNQSVDLSLDLPNLADANHPAGAKIWLVPSSDYSGNQLNAWNPASYLFDKGLVNYNDTEVN